MSSRSKSWSSSLKRKFRKCNDSDSDDSTSRRHSSSADDGKRRKITQEQITEYLTKQAQRKATKKLKESSVFVWRKKIEKEGVPFSAKAEKKRQRERVAEIEKLKRRREERAHEKAQHEEEMAVLARRAEYQGWEQKEVEFLLAQSKVRSEIRLREGRMKPIDVLLLSSKQQQQHVSSEVFKGLTGKEMEELCEDIKMHLHMDREHMDYWEALLVVCNWELARKKDERGMQSSIEADVRNVLEGGRWSVLQVLISGIEYKLSSGTAQVVEYWEALLKRLHMYEAKARLSEAGSFSPELLLHGDDNNEEAIDPLEEQNPPPQEEQLRKPLFLNRVHTGYEWNKYNQTHYDHDNPPPKFVQGYKFNIFYPDLVHPPEYKIEKDGSNDETCIIKFHAGPPYQDVAFKIVNKEWEYSQKNGGFKCTFQSGILRLYINFKRYRYRK